MQIGICVSTGSACSSGSTNPSHVLMAIGLDQDLAKGAIRVTFGKENTRDDVNYLIYVISQEVERLRKNSAEYKHICKYR